MAYYLDVEAVNPTDSGRSFALDNPWSPTAKNNFTVIVNLRTFTDLNSDQFVIGHDKEGTGKSRSWKLFLNDGKFGVLHDDNWTVGGFILHPDSLSINTDYEVRVEFTPDNLVTIFVNGVEGNSSPRDPDPIASKPMLDSIGASSGGSNRRGFNGGIYSASLVDNVNSANSLYYDASDSNGTGNTLYESAIGGTTHDAVAQNDAGSPDWWVYYEALNYKLQVDGTRFVTTTYPTDILALNNFKVELDQVYWTDLTTGYLCSKAGNIANVRDFGIYFATDGLNLYWGGEATQLLTTSEIATHFPNAPTLGDLSFDFDVVGSSYVIAVNGSPIKSGSFTKGTGTRPWVLFRLFARSDNTSSSEANMYTGAYIAANGSQIGNVRLYDDNVLTASYVSDGIGDYWEEPRSGYYGEVHNGSIDNSQWVYYDGAGAANVTGLTTLNTQLRESIANTPSFSTSFREPVSTSQNITAQFREPVSASQNITAQFREPVSTSQNITAQFREPVSTSQNITAQFREPVSTSQSITAQFREAVTQPTAVTTTFRQSVTDTTSLNTSFRAALASTTAITFDLLSGAVNFVTSLTGFNTSFRESVFDSTSITTSLRSIVSQTHSLDTSFRQSVPNTETLITSLRSSVSQTRSLDSSFRQSVSGTETLSASLRSSVSQTRSLDTSFRQSVSGTETLITSFIGRVTHLASLTTSFREEVTGYTDVSFALYGELDWATPAHKVTFTFNTTAVPITFNTTKPII